MYNGHWFGGGFMWLFWILLIVAIIWGIKMATSDKSNSATTKKSALDILKERYASGEIDLDEYDRMKKELGNL